MIPGDSETRGFATGGVVPAPLKPVTVGEPIRHVFSSGALMPQGKLSYVGERGAEMFNGNLETSDEWVETWTTGNNVPFRNAIEISIPSSGTVLLG
jgi:hypothetical protein